MDRDQWYTSNRPRAVLVAKVTNKDGKILTLCRKVSSKLVCDLPFVLPSNRSEPINQILSGLHAQTGLSGDVLTTRETGTRLIVWNEEELMLPVYEFEIKIKEEKIFLAKGFESFEWVKEKKI
ncbi:hypothetical protein HY990_03385 [Candidatus Micrarchaeota archaeon]|nr:hypothetical protein [Candidatus Micrarchaeota archaeon]